MITTPFINRLGVLTLLVALLCTSCLKHETQLEPQVSYKGFPARIALLPSAFTELSSTESDSDWGREYRAAKVFAKDNDYYRAITSYKKTLVWIPDSESTRIMEIHYHILLSYYLGHKHKAVIDYFEQSPLRFADKNFPAFQDLLTLLYDSYLQIGEAEKAEQIRQAIASIDKEEGTRLHAHSAVYYGDFAAMDEGLDSLQEFRDSYEDNKLSVKTARLLNIIPGAGYAYVGQKKTAFTAFILNTVFTAATVYFAKNDNIPMAIILAGLETGWYFGGINGAGIAAKEYNDNLYSKLGKSLLRTEKAFPIFNLNYAF
ncbi:MAG: hypothetical protein CMO81_12260 [Waddliaceae bacterium]|nr:hypothetical protein [Waddliaceae bacterium]